MRKSLLLMLLIVILIPAQPFVAGQAVSAAKSGVSTTSSAQASTAAGSGFYEWFRQLLKHQEKKTTSSCGPNFCTQAQRTQCAQSCRHAPFVGLECCADTCTSFCNCGSVPTGGC